MDKKAKRRTSFSLVIRVFDRYQTERKGNRCKRSELSEGTRSGYEELIENNAATYYK